MFSYIKINQEKIKVKKKFKILKDKKIKRPSEELFQRQREKNNEVTI